MDFRKTHERTNFIVWCIVICMTFPLMFPFLAFAEDTNTKLNVDGVAVPLSVQPYENDLGVMVDAREISDAFGFSYNVDTEDKTFTITHEKYGDIILMHNATKFYSGDNVYECKPYFYMENTIPMVELGFFCSMFQCDYEYDETSDTIYIDRNKVELLSDDLAVEPNNAVSGGLQGKIFYDGGVQQDFLTVKLTVTSTEELYGKPIYVSSITLDPLTLKKGETEISYSYDAESLKSAQFTSNTYCLSYSIAETFKYGYINSSGETTHTPSNNFDVSTAKLFDAFENNYADIDLDTSSVGGSVNGTISFEQGVSLPDTGLDVKLFLKTAQQSRDCMYFHSYWNEGKLIELGTVHLDNGTETKSFNYDLRPYQTSTSYPNYVLFYEIGERQSFFMPHGYYNSRGKMTNTYNNIANFHFNKSTHEKDPHKQNIISDTFDPKILYLKQDTNLALTLPGFSSAPFGEFGDGFEWSFDVVSGTLTINGNGAMPEYTTPPWNEYVSYVRNVILNPGITEINASAFSNYSGLTSITIPDSVTSIGWSAFKGCSGLESITIPDGVTSIGGSAFYGCSGLKSITIPDSVTNIDNYAFKGCSGLESITIPDSVTSIGDYAFEGCSGLTSITILDCVTSIGDYAFYGCTALDSVYITDIVKWCNCVFDTQYSNPMNYATKLYINNELLTSFTALDIPAGAYRIPDMMFKDCNNLKSITIPDGVTNIGDSAFENCSSLTNITIPDSVTSIGRSAFNGCSSLTRITIPDSVTSIGSYTFYGCSSLTNITIPDSVTSIGHYTFVGCSSLENIIIPDGITYIGYDTFYGCRNLINITIPNSVTSIGERAFNYCSNLKSITIPDSVTSIGERAFEGCNNLEEVHINDLATWCNISFHNETSNPLSYGAKLYIQGELTNTITIPNNITSIDSYAFYGCSSLTSITIPDSVTSIGNNAFYNCSSLTSVTLPNSITNISKYMFYGCRNLINITIPNSVTSIGERAFNYCSSLSSIIIPDSVTSIGEFAFTNCSSLTSVRIPDSITIINNSVFWGCSSLTSITIPNSVTSIGDYAFRNCRSLESINIPDSVTSIGSYAFYSCSNLTSITIPDSVTSIGSYAFYGCNNLTDIILSEFNKNYSSIDGNLFSKDKTILLCYTAGKPIKEYIIPSNVKEIANGAFGGCSNLTNITIHDNVIKIASSAFDGCSSLENIIVNETNKNYSSVDGNLFSKDKTILLCYAKGKKNKEYIIPNDVVKIGNYAFNGCNNLEYTTMSDSIAKIDSYAFYGCRGLKNITIPNRLTSIGDSAFENCSSLTNITIPDSVTSIGRSAFNGCSSLTNVTIPDSVTSIGYSAFRNCSSLEIITIPDSVTNIGGSVCFGCSSLTSITIPNSVTSIASAAFRDCSSLTSITIPDSVTSIGNLAFYGCSSLESVAVPDSITSISDYVFSGCVLKDVYYRGSYQQWKAIKIASNNDRLTNSIIHYNYTGDIPIPTLKPTPTPTVSPAPSPTATPKPTPTPNPDIAITTPDTYTINTIEKTDSGVTLTVQTNEDVSGKQTVMAACYDEKGVFVGLQYQQILSSEKEQIINFDIKNKDTATVKAFIWNAIDYMMPASRPVSLEL